MKLPLLLCLLVPVFLCAQETPLPPKEKFHLFVLAGQSNMAGRGEVSPDDRKPHPRVLMLDKAGNWVPAVDPMHFDKPKVIGVGPGRAVGIALAENNPDITIGLIPCAVGGSPIDTWKPGAFDEPTQTHPWDDAIKRVHASLTAGTLKGILWHQGESDSKPKLAPAYADKLHDLVARFRKEFSAPAVPFIAGQLGQFPEKPWDEDRMLVNQAHQSLPKQVPHTAFVRSDGLKHKGDQVHFDAESARELGRRYAKAFLELQR